MATVDVVQMPYLDNDGTTYYPNQLLVHSRHYKYNLADIVMMEDDGDTNYLQLAQAIASVAADHRGRRRLRAAGQRDPRRHPASWWTDDPDYVDSWYTLSTASSGRLNGAAANGWMDAVPHLVEHL